MQEATEDIRPFIPDDSFTSLVRSTKEQDDALLEQMLDYNVLKWAMPISTL